MQLLRQVFLAKTNILIEEKINAIFFSFYFSFFFFSSAAVAWNPLGKNYYLTTVIDCFFSEVAKRHSKSEKSKQPQCSLMFPVFLDCSTDDSQIQHEKGVGNGNRSYPALPSNTRSFTCARREDLGNLAEEVNTCGVFWQSCKIWKMHNPLAKLVHCTNQLS